MSELRNVILQTVKIPDNVHDSERFLDTVDKQVPAKHTFAVTFSPQPLVSTFLKGKRMVL